MVVERVTLFGHLLDEKTLTRVLDGLSECAVEYEIRRIHLGRFSTDGSMIELVIRAENLDLLQAALKVCEEYGGQFSVTEATLAEADMDGVLPENFYSTTNFVTYVLHQGEWIEIENLEMDCGVRVWHDGTKWRAATCAMHRVRKGDKLVVGFDGIRISPSEVEETDGDEFKFMSNDVSTERPKKRLVALLAHAMKRARAEGKHTLLVGGPAIIHSGSGALLAQLVRDGWVNVLFAGNALAAHDIESNMMGTSLGVDLESGAGVSHGHSHHLRAINRVRRAGSIRAAVEQGLITDGVMHTLVRTNTPFVLCGSIRDDGPLPDVITDAVVAQDTMRQYVGNVGVCMMVATMLHSVAVGNILPASVRTFCVDTDADTVIKLTDRGTHQAVGIVTDCEYFLSELLRALAS